MLLDSHNITRFISLCIKEETGLTVHHEVRKDSSQFFSKRKQFTIKNCQSKEKHQS